jgi:hypothetical protein
MRRWRKPEFKKQVRDYIKATYNKEKTEISNKFAQRVY